MVQKLEAIAELYRPNAALQAELHSPAYVAPDKLSAAPYAAVVLAYKANNAKPLAAHPSQLPRSVEYCDGDGGSGGSCDSCDSCDSGGSTCDSCDGGDGGGSGDW